jgi:hypothetical protein
MTVDGSSGPQRIPRVKRTVTKATLERLWQEHVTRRGWADELSRRTFYNALEDLGLESSAEAGVDNQWVAYNEEHDLLCATVTELCKGVCACVLSVPVSLAADATSSLRVTQRPTSTALLPASSSVCGSYACTSSTSSSTTWPSSALLGCRAFSACASSMLRCFCLLPRLVVSPLLPATSGLTSRALLRCALSDPASPEMQAAPHQHAAEAADAAEQGPYSKLDDLFAELRALVDDVKDTESASETARSSLSDRLTRGQDETRRFAAHVLRTVHSNAFVARLVRELPVGGRVRAALSACASSFHLISKLQIVQRAVCRADWKMTFEAMYHKQSQGGFFGDKSSTYSHLAHAWLTLGSRLAHAWLMQSFCGSACSSSWQQPRPRVIQMTRATSQAIARTPTTFASSTAARSACLSVGLSVYVCAYTHSLSPSLTSSLPPSRRTRTLRCALWRQVSRALAGTCRISRRLIW